VAIAELREEFLSNLRVFREENSVHVRVLRKEHDELKTSLQSIGGLVDNLYNRVDELEGQIDHFGQTMNGMFEEVCMDFRYIRGRLEADLPRGPIFRQINEDGNGEVREGEVAETESVPGGDDERLGDMESLRGGDPQVEGEVEGENNGEEEVAVHPDEGGQNEKQQVEGEEEAVETAKEGPKEAEAERAPSRAPSQRPSEVETGPEAETGPDVPPGEFTTPPPQSPLDLSPLTPLPPRHGGDGLEAPNSPSRPPRRNVKRGLEEAQIEESEEPAEPKKATKKARRRKA
jgi:hypothetical protein